MSTVKTNNVQVGQSLTATNNFTWYQPSSPDGTVRLGVGNSGATTSDVITITGSTGAAVLSGTVKSASGGFIFPDNTTQTTAATSAFSSGTKLAFPQASAPTGWTQDTSVNDYAMRVVSGTGGGSGGSVAFTTAFASQTPAGSVSVSGGSVSATTLSTNEIPSHTHGLAASGNSGAETSIGNIYGAAAVSGGRTIATSGRGFSSYVTTSGGGNNWIGSTGGGGSHTHGFTTPTASFSGTAINLAVQYKDFIIATKD